MCLPPAGLPAAKFNIAEDSRKATNYSLRSAVDIQAPRFHLPLPLSLLGRSFSSSKSENCSALQSYRRENITATNNYITHQDHRYGFICHSSRSAAPQISTL